MGDSLPLLLAAACTLVAVGALVAVVLRSRARRRRFGGPPILSPATSEAQRSRLLAAQFYLRSCARYRFERALPNVSARDDRALCVVRADRAAAGGGGGGGLLRRVLCCGGGGAARFGGLRVSSCGGALDLHDRGTRAALRALLEGVEHESVAPVRLVDFVTNNAASQSLVVVVRDWAPSGSLRDLIHGAPPEAVFAHKYGGAGRPLSEARCALHGRQLLHALMTLRPLGGWTAVHAHCGNLFVDGRGRLRYADWEGALLHDGAAPLAHFIRALRGTLDPAVAALAHALYEMGCGFEADAPRPSVYPPCCARPLVRCLEALFNPPPGTELPLTLDDAAALPFFARAAARAPPPPPLPRPDRAALALLRRLRPHLEAASGEGDGDGAALERAGGRNGTHAFDDDSPSRFETALEIDDGRDRSWSLDRGPKVL